MLIALFLIVLIIAGNMINQTFLQYCATNPVSLGVMFVGYLGITGLMVAIFLILRKLFVSQKDEYKHHIDIEKIDDNFKTVYNRLKVENISELEALRKKVMIQEFGVYFGIFLAMSVFFSAGVVLKNVTNETVVTFSGCCQAMPFVGVFIAILFASWGSQYGVQYKKIYKENILPSFIKLIDPNLEYYYQKYQKYKPYKIYTKLQFSCRVNKGQTNRHIHKCQYCRCRLGCMEF